LIVGEFSRSVVIAGRGRPSRQSDPRFEASRMIRFYFHPSPNPLKVALFLEESGLAYELAPVDTRKGEQHAPEFRAVNPNGKVPAIVDTDGPGGEAARVFDSSAILLYLGTKTGRFIGKPHDWPELLSWLFFVATGIGPYSGQAVHFQHAAPEKIPYAINRYRREVERHYRVLDDHLTGREFLVGDDYSIADMSAWGWLDRAPRVLPGADDALAAFPNLERWFHAIDRRPAAARARAVGKDRAFKQEIDEEARRALYPSNYPPTPNRASAHGGDRGKQETTSS
jgi:GST-like protein